MSCRRKNNPYNCPALKGKILDSKVPQGVGSIYEIVINGIDEESVRCVMKAGIVAVVVTRRIIIIGASNFGGKLGQYRLSLHELFR